jgi:hypothetical protein
VASFPQIAGALPHPQTGRDDLVVERGHKDLDAVVLEDADAVEQVLLRERHPSRDARRWWSSQLVDELVETARGQRRSRGSADDLPPSQPHVN